MKYVLGDIVVCDPTEVDQGIIRVNVHVSIGQDAGADTISLYVVLPYDLSVSIAELRSKAKTRAAEIFEAAAAAMREA